MWVEFETLDETLVRLEKSCVNFFNRLFTRVIFFKNLLDF